MADSYRSRIRCVLIANGVYFMWYTADDSNNQRVGYATSLDGVTWDRGGIVFDVGDGGNYSEGAFAPGRRAHGLETPDPADDAFHMIFTGNKTVAGGDIQSKLINADQRRRHHLDAGNIAFNPAGGDRRSTATTSRSRRSCTTRRRRRTRTRCGTSATTPTTTATSTTASASPIRSSRRR